MAPKETLPSDPFLRAVFMHAEEIKINWDGVAKQCGIAYSKNAKRRFLDSILKPLDLKYEGSKITAVDDDAHSTDLRATPAEDTGTSSLMNGLGAKKDAKPAAKRRRVVKKKSNSDGDSDEVPKKVETKSEGSVTPETEVTPGDQDT